MRQEFFYADCRRPSTTFFKNFFRPAARGGKKDSGPASSCGPPRLSAIMEGMEAHEHLSGRDREALSDAAQLALLQDLASLVSNPADSGSVLDKALALMAGRLHLMRGSITLVSPSTGEIRIQASYGLKSSERLRGRYVPGEGVTGRVIQTGEAMCVSNVSREPLFLNRTRSRDLKREAVSFICVPIWLHGEVVGAVSADHLLTDAATLEEEMRLLYVVAGLLAHTAYENQRFMDRASGAPARPRGFVGNSEAMRRVYEQLLQVAPSSTTVFLQGESGTGKELAARALHAASSRADNPFVSLNCAALPENLIESELFGHEKGAFTGASAVRKGRFELADQGTLFLDEVGELTLTTQAKLLRVLQERTFERLGGMRTLHADVRIVTATNRDLESMVKAGQFRQDLFYRLNVFPIFLPPLRARQDDILPLANHFLQKYALAAGRDGARLSLAVMDMLQRYRWPGNIRELENAMERAVLLLGRENLVLPQHLPPAMHRHALSEAVPGGDACQVLSISLQDRLDELERACIVDALTVHRGHMGHAAASLGLTERIMALRMKKYGLCYKDYRKAAQGLVSP